MENRPSWEPTQTNHVVVATECHRSKGKKYFEMVEYCYQHLAIAINLTLKRYFRYFLL